MLNALFETVTISEKVNGVDVEIVVQEMTYGKAKALPLKLYKAYAAFQNGDSAGLAQSVDEVIGGFIAVTIAGQPASSDDLPLSIMGRAVSEFIALNFTPSKTQAWRSVFDQFNKLTLESPV